MVYEGEKKLDPGSRYVFGYAPHGLFPIGEPFFFYGLNPFHHACAAVRPQALLLPVSGILGRHSVSVR